LTEGSRSYSDQNSRFAQGRGAPGRQVTRARGGESFHNFGLAYDVGVFDGRHYVADGSDPRYRRAGELGEAVNDGMTNETSLEWGGRWKTPDMPHFQFSGGLPLHEIRKRYDAGEPIF
jgi:peptidoglycan L-alanyl-D-glutamate endopeptidase CwlK